MIEIELDADVLALRLGDEVGGVLDPVEEIARPVARIDRLDQQRDVLLRREVGGLHQIATKTVSPAGRCSGGSLPASTWICRPPIATT